MKPEVKPYRYCAKSLDNGKISIREAIRFEANPETNFIYAIYYDDWDEFVHREPILKTNDTNELYLILSAISQFYNINPEGLLDFLTNKFNFKE